MKLWHDDIRRPPLCRACGGSGESTECCPGAIEDCRTCGGRGTEWVWVRSNYEARVHLSAQAHGYPVEEVSLDHDMGLDDQDPDEPEAAYRVGHSPEDGMALVKWMCDNEFVPPKVTIHTMNPAGARNMACHLHGWAKAFDRDIEVKVRPWSG